MRKELRCKLEREVKEFQDNLQRDEDSAYFRQLEADRLRGKFQMSTQSALYWKKKKEKNKHVLMYWQGQSLLVEIWTLILNIGRILAKRFSNMKNCCLFRVNNWIYGTLASSFF